MKAYFYLKQNNRSPLEEYISKIRQKREIAIIKALIDKLIEENGILPPPFAKKVFGKIWELRSRLGNRIFYTIHNGKIILLDGYTKKQDKIPRRKIIQVQNYYHDYLVYKYLKVYEN